MKVAPEGQTASTGQPGAPSAAADVGAKPTPSAPEPMATGLIVAPGQALTALASADCANPTVDGKAAKILRADAPSGLALIAGDFGAGAAPPNLGAGSAELVVLSFEPGAADEDHASSERRDADAGRAGEARGFSPR